MANIQDIAIALKQIESDLAKCARCGMCLAACPVYSETGREADAARGKLALVDGLAEKVFDSARGVSDRLDRCLLCGSCAAICPNGVNASEIFLKARMAISSAAQLPSIQKYALKKLMADPAVFDRAMKWGRRLQKVAAKKERPVLGTSSFRLSSANPRRRHFIPPAPSAFLKSMDMETSPNPSSGPRVLFFIGCLIDKFFPRIADATVAVFHYHHMNVVIPTSQGCCGIPSASAGDGDTMIQLIRHHLTLFADYDFDVVVTACATCTHVIKNIWPQMVKNESEDLHSGAMEIAAKTRDISQFLVSHIQNTEPRPEGKGDIRRVTYHDPCHLKKSLGVHTQPRALITANSSYRLVEMDKPDRCCGMGGSFNLSHYDLSGKIGNRKIEAITATHCRTVATGCPACMMQLADLLSKSGRDITIKHPIEIYAEVIQINGS